MFSTLLKSDLHQDRKAQFTTKMYAPFSILNISGNMTANTHLQLCGKLQCDETFCEEAFLFLCNCAYVHTSVFMRQSQISREGKEVKTDCPKILI